MFRRLWFDICGRCNGRCPWCQTGHRNLQRRSDPAQDRPEPVAAGRAAHEGFISPADFARAMDYMLDQGIIGPNSQVAPYNYGEAFLHPQFQEIIAQIHRYGLKFGLSTNASRVRTFHKPVLKNLQHLAFSMPGFSQASYDRIHGFDFETVKANIATIVRNFRECGFEGNAFIAYHIYQFNQDEIVQACDFAVDHGLGLNAYCAFFNDLNMYLDYLGSKMPYERLKRASQELVLHYVESLRARQPAEFKCPSWNEVTLNERCQVLLCCAVDKSGGPGVLGDLFQMTGDMIREARAQHELCKRCMSAGCAYLFYTPHKIAAWPHPPADATVPSPDAIPKVSYINKVPACAGYIESVSPASYPDSLVVEGWARDPVNDCATSHVLLLDNKGKVVALGQVSLRRKDVSRVAHYDPVRMRNCGWRLRFRRSQLTPGAQYLIGYAFDLNLSVAFRMANEMPLP